MADIEILQDNIKKVKKFLEQDNKQLEKEPQNLFLLMSRRSNQFDLDQLYAKLKAEKEKRHVEVLDMRLIAPSLKHGTIPLGMLAKIADFFSVLIHASSNKLSTGRDSVGRIPRHIIEDIDLRLSGLASGSTRLVLTGKTNPDMFGRSVLEETLRNLYILLEEGEESSDFGDELGNLGQRGARNLQELFGLFLSKNIQLDLTWYDPTNRVNIWKGNYGRVQSIYNNLSNLTIEKPRTEIVSGVITLLSETGRISIREPAEINKPQTIYIRYTPNNFVEVSQLTLGQNVSIKCEVQTIVNSSTLKVRKIYYFLELA